MNIPKEVYEGQALARKSDMYPGRYHGKVPLKVKLTMDTGSDLPSFIKPTIFVHKGEEYFVSVNSHGAVSAILKDGEMLGLKPNEFEVISWHE